MKKPCPNPTIEIIGIILVVISTIVYCNFYCKNKPINDCVPATLIRVIPNKTLSEMTTICKTGRYGTTIEQFMAAWTNISTNALKIEYSVITNYPINTDEEIQFDYPYIWIGNIKNIDHKYYYHCCLIRFDSNTVTLSHSQYYPNSTNYYCTTLSYKDFLSNTIIVASAPEFTNHYIELY